MAEGQQRGVELGEAPGDLVEGAREQSHSPSLDVGLAADAVVLVLDEEGTGYGAADLFGLLNR